MKTMDDRQTALRKAIEAESLARTMSERIRQLASDASHIAFLSRDFAEFARRAEDGKVCVRARELRNRIESLDYYMAVVTPSLAAIRSALSPSTQARDETGAEDRRHIPPSREDQSPTADALRPTRDGDDFGQANEQPHEAPQPQPVRSDQEQTSEASILSVGA